jgi:hypothetical protein
MARSALFNRIFIRAPFLFWLPALLVALWAVASAYQLRWTADDAFISFRYARAAAAGNGLTFNPGERVEGYTNFLWTVLLVPAEYLKLNVEHVAWCLGLAAYCGLLVSIYWHMRKDEIWPGFFAAFCLLDHSRIFATSGLETSLFAFLITAGLLQVARGPGSATRGFPVLALASLTRPDGVLVYLAAGLYCIREGAHGTLREWLRAQLRLHLPAMILLLPVWALRSLYYGDIVPNTFYAKSAYRAFASQGLIYAGLFAQSYWLLSAMTLLALLLPRSWRGPARLYAMSIAIWLLYVIYVGGDFMFARFLVPVLPAACLLLHEVLCDVLHQRPFLRAAIYSGLCLSLVFRPDPFARSPVVGHISEEHKIYTREGRRALANAALGIRADLLASSVRVGFVGAQAAFLYYWYPLFGIESETGLTDKSIASQTLSERGKVGHEKQARFEYLRERGVHLLMRPPPEGWPPAKTVRLRGIPGEMTIVLNEAAVFDSLKASGAVESPTRP